MTLNGNFAILFCAGMFNWSSEAWLLKLSYTLKFVVNIVGEL